MSSASFRSRSSTLDPSSSITYTHNSVNSGLVAGIVLMVVLLFVFGGIIISLTVIIFILKKQQQNHKERDTQEGI